MKISYNSEKISSLAKIWIFTIISYYFFTYKNNYDSEIFTIEIYILFLIIVIILSLIYYGWKDIKEFGYNLSNFLIIFPIIFISMIIMEKIFGTGQTWMESLIYIFLMMFAQSIFLAGYLILYAIKSWRSKKISKKA